MRKIKPKQDEYMVSSGISSPKKKEKSKPIYPTFRVELPHLPEAKKWDLGKEYTINMKVKLVGLSQSRYDNSAEFEIHEIEGKSAESTEEEAEEEGDGEE